MAEGPYPSTETLQQQIRALEIQAMSASGDQAASIREQIAGLKRQLAMITGISKAFQ